jgi:hypothetical protein
MSGKAVSVEPGDGGAYCRLDRERQAGAGLQRFPD